MSYKLKFFNKIFVKNIYLKKVFSLEKNCFSQFFCSLGGNFVFKYLKLFLLSMIIGNMWGTCDNGTEAVGCGRPETFRNCADVSIITSTGGVPPLFVEEDNPFLLYYREYDSPNNIFPLIIRQSIIRILEITTKRFKFISCI